MLALAPTLTKGRPESISVPVYLGDALQWNTRELMSKSELEILVPPALPGDPPTVLRFPEDVIDQPQLFDQVINAMLGLAQSGQPTKAMTDWLRSHAVPGDPKMLAETYDKLVALNEEGRNHIWGYVARNLSRPIWLATERQKADIVLGNPPWVRYTLSKANQARLKQEATTANVWVGGKAATANDLSAGNVTGIIPWNPNSREVMDSEGALTIGKRKLADWLAAAEALWEEHGTGGMLLQERWDYGRAISSQFPLAKFRVLFAASGTQPAAVKLVGDTTTIAEHKLYWASAATASEANYLCGVLNSETARAAAEHWQSEGQWGKRDFDKAVFNLPIPTYNANLEFHQDIAKAAARAEKIAAKVDLKEGEYFTSSRRRIRQALIDHGVAGQIETLVATLIGVAAPATLSAGSEEPDDDDAD